MKSSAFITRYLLVFAIWFFFFNFAILYGKIWNSQVFPTIADGLYINNGLILSGSLSLNWDNYWVLTQPDGTTLEIDESSIRKIVVPNSFDSNSPFKIWRTWLPATTLTLSLFVYLLYQIANHRRLEQAKYY